MRPKLTKKDNRTAPIDMNIQLTDVAWSLSF